MEKRFYIKFSGAAWDIRAESPEQAWKDIRDYLYCYCTSDIQEINVDCDELGYKVLPQSQKLDT
jgi:hypothetical protein